MNLFGQNIMKQCVGFALIATVLCFASCNYKPAPNSNTSGTAVVMCDQSFQNVLEQEIEAFEYDYPNANILVRYIDEYAALDSLFKGDVDVVITAHDLNANQKQYLSAHGRAYRSMRIAVDAVAMIVNKHNEIDELDMDDLRDIFTGKYKRWGELYPTNLKNDSIYVVFDGNGSSITRFMKEKFLGNKPFQSNVYAQKSTQDVFDLVEHRKNAIGFVGVSWLSPDLKRDKASLSQRMEKLKNSDDAPDNEFTTRVKVLGIRPMDKIRAFKPYQYYINTGDYPLFRSIYAIDAAQAGTLSHGFYVFLTSVLGQKVILNAGVLPAAEPVRVVEVQ